MGRQHCTQPGIKIGDGSADALLPESPDQRATPAAAVGKGIRFNDSKKSLSIGHCELRQTCAPAVKELRANCDSSQAPFRSAQLRCSRWQGATRMARKSSAKAAQKADSEADRRRASTFKPVGPPPPAPRATSGPAARTTCADKPQPACEQRLPSSVHVIAKDPSPL